MRRRHALLVLTGLSCALLTVGSTSQAGGFCSDGRFTDERTTEISMVAMCFSPTVARIDVGDTVTFKNDDSTLHAVGGVNNTFGNLHTELAPGKAISYRFDEEGVFPYMCIMHPGMGGAIVVGDGEGDATAQAAVPPVATGRDEPTTAETGSTGPAPAIWIAAVVAIATLGLALVVRGRSLHANRPAGSLDLG